MADGDKTFTEAEHIAILADRVRTETAAVVAERDELATANDDLQTKLDVAESAKVAAEQRAEKAEQDLADHKAEDEKAREQAARKDERLGKVKEVAAHLGEDFFADEKRVERIVAMDEAAFDGYVEDLKATAPAGTTTTTVPRETAMAGESAAPPASDSASRTVLLGRFGGAQKGA